MDDEIVKIEMKMAYLEDFLKELQEVTVQQGKLIENLQNENKAMKSKIKELSDSLEGDIPNVRPPHY